MRSWGSRGSEMSVCLAMGDLSSEENSSLSSWSNHCELIESVALSSGGQDLSTGALGESQSTDAHLGEFHTPIVVQNVSSDNSDSVAFVSEVNHEPRSADLRAVPVAHDQSLEDNAVELAGSATTHESVKSH